MKLWVLAVALGSGLLGLFAVSVLPMGKGSDQRHAVSVVEKKVLPGDSQESTSLFVADDQGGGKKPHHRNTPNNAAGQLLSLEQELQTWRNCALGRGNPCGIPETDPKAPFFAATRRIEEALIRSQSILASHPQMEDQGRAMAEAFLDYPEGSIQSRALQILASLPPSLSSFEAIKENLPEIYDEHVVAKALQQLARYPQRHDELTSMLADMIQTGGHFAAIKTTQNLGPFLNPNNIHEFRQILSALPQDSVYHRELEKVLSLYEPAHLPG